MYRFIRNCSSFHSIVSSFKNAFSTSIKTYVNVEIGHKGFVRGGPLPVDKETENLIASTFPNMETGKAFGPQTEDDKCVWAHSRKRHKTHQPNVDSPHSDQKNPIIQNEHEGDDVVRQQNIRHELHFLRKGPQFFVVLSHSGTCFKKGFNASSFKACLNLLNKSLLFQ